MLVGGVQFRNALGAADEQAEVAQVTKRHADGIDDVVMSPFGELADLGDDHVSPGAIRRVDHAFGEQRLHAVEAR